MLKICLSLVLAVWCCPVLGQAQSADSVKKLDEVTVKGYYRTQPLLRSTAALSLIDSSQIKNHSASSMLGVVNAIAGVRMEERSPGSYRLSLRGSLLRSPFGIRNLKIYIDDFPLTDAGGNTYLNSLDISAIGDMEIYKGPEASLFGANTGGAILIKPVSPQSNKTSFGLTSGSYGLIHQTAALQKVYKNYSFSLTQAYQQSEGYRENSALKRFYIQALQALNYNKAGSLKALVFYSDLAYQTPGGLTAIQLVQNPKMARPATQTLLGAITQKAAIYNHTLFAGLANTYQLNPNFQHVVSVFTSYTDFKNPFITNYEKRDESTLGLRTLVNYKPLSSSWNAQIGVESSSTASLINNFDNHNGLPTAPQAKDKLRASQTFAFLLLNFEINKRLLIELASSLNLYGYQYASYFPEEIARTKKTFTKQLMPRLAASYLLHPQLALRASISKGYSPPTLAEVRASDNVINNNLQAEYGWNYELGLRFKSTGNRSYLNVNLFNYHLKDAIVRRLNQNDTEYFINAGGTAQKGVEIEAVMWLISQPDNRWLSGLQLRNSYTYSNFKFVDFLMSNTNFSGNSLTGVPKHNVASSLLFQFAKGFNFFVSHQFTSSIPLNDANTVKAKAYHLVDVKLRLKPFKISRAAVEIFGGINNVLNEKYSLGNDLNAANGRYYNPAATLNFYTGLTLKF